MPRDLDAELQDFGKRLAVLQALFESRTQAVKDFDAELVTLRENRDLLSRVDETLLLVSSKVLGQSTDQIDRLVTTGLRLVFEDQDLEFKTRIEKFRGKTSIKFDLFHAGETAPLADSFGGGVLCVAGVLLRIVTIMTLGLRRVLFLDETLSHLSEVYIGNCSRLLKKLADELDFSIVLVTHADGYADHADRHYVAKSGQTGTEFVLQTS